MDKDEIIERLANLFDAKDMSEMDAADFVDNAGETFELYLAAKELVNSC